MDSLQPLFTHSHIEILVAKDSQLTPVDLKGICTALKVSVALGQNIITGCIRLLESEILGLF